MKFGKRSLDRILVGGAQFPNLSKNLGWNMIRLLLPFFKHIQWIHMRKSYEWEWKSLSYSFFFLYCHQIYNKRRIQDVMREKLQSQTCIKSFTHQHNCKIWVRHSGQKPRNYVWRFWESSTEKKITYYRIRPNLLMWNICQKFLNQSSRLKN